MKTVLMGLAIACGSLGLHANMVNSVMSITEKVTIAGITEPRVYFDELKKVIGEYIISENILKTLQEQGVTEQLEEQAKSLEQASEAMVNQLKKAGLNDQKISNLIGKLFQTLEALGASGQVDNIDHIKKELLNVLNNTREFAPAKMHFEALIELMLAMQAFAITSNMASLCANASEAFENQKKLFLARGYTQEQFESIVTIFAQELAQMIQQLQEIETTGQQ